MANMAAQLIRQSYMFNGSENFHKHLKVVDARAIRCYATTKAGIIAQEHAACWYF